MHCSCATKIHAFEKENIALTMLTLIGLQKQHDRMLLHVMNLHACVSISETEVAFASMTTTE